MSRARARQVQFPRPPVESGCLLALDPATSCGWAVLDHEGARLASGVWRLDRRGALPRPAELLVQLDALEVELGSERYLWAVALEVLPPARGLATAATLQRLYGVVEAWAGLRGRPLLEAPPSSVKLWATGSGRADKSAMVAAAARRYGVQVGDDEADALLVGGYAHHRWGSGGQ